MFVTNRRRPRYICSNSPHLCTECMRCGLTQWRNWPGAKKGSCPPPRRSGRGGAKQPLVTKLMKNKVCYRLVWLPACLGVRPMVISWHSGLSAPARKSGAPLFGRGRIWLPAPGAANLPVPLSQSPLCSQYANRPFGHKRRCTKRLVIACMARNTDLKNLRRKKSRKGYRR